MNKSPPTLRGKSAEQFYKNINNGNISNKQKQFLKECEELIDLELNHNKLQERKRRFLIDKLLPILLIEFTIGFLIFLILLQSSLTN